MLSYLLLLFKLVLSGLWPWLLTRPRTTPHLAWLLLLLLLRSRVPLSVLWFLADHRRTYRDCHLMFAFLLNCRDPIWEGKLLSPSHSMLCWWAVGRFWLHVVWLERLLLWREAVIKAGGLTSIATHLWVYLVYPVYLIIMLLDRHCLCFPRLLNNLFFFLLLFLFCNDLLLVFLELVKPLFQFCKIFV